MKCDIIEEDARFPSSVDILEVVYERSIEIVRLTRDVFASAYDLVVLDRSHKIFGGHWGKADEFDAIQSILDELYGTFPMGWTEFGSNFFLPGLSMGADVRSKVGMMSEAAQFEVYVKVKRALVNSEQPRVKTLDRRFWEKLIGEPIENRKGAIAGEQMNEKFGELFLGQRYLDRFGGNARALDQMVSPHFNIDDAVATMKALVSQLPVDAVKRHDEACGEHRAIAV